MAQRQGKRVFYQRIYTDRYSVAANNRSTNNKALSFTKFVFEVDRSETCLDDVE